MMQSHKLVPQAPKQLQDLAFDIARTCLIGRFYYRHLQRFRPIQLFAQRLWRFSLPHYLPLIIPNVHAQPFLFQRDAVKHLHATSTTLVPAQTLQVPTPEIFPAKALGCFLTPPKPYVFPAITATVFRDATVHGSTNFIFVDGTVVHHDLYDFKNDYSSEEMHSRAIITLDKKRIYWFVRDVALPPLARAATLLDGCALNYAHWLTEVLPRAAILASEPAYDGVPVLVNAGLHANLMQSLKLVVGERPIIAVANRESVRVTELIVISPTGYVPFEPRKLYASNPSHGVFSPVAFHRMIERVQTSIGPHTDAATHIYIRRNSNARNISNADMIEQQLVAYGFTIIEPEKLSFIEQAKLFSGAKVIIGATGAAMANAIFCQPGTQIGILIANHRKLLYRYWGNMLLAAGVRLSYITCRKEKIGANVHSEFMIDTADLNAFLETIECK